MWIWPPAVLKLDSKKTEGSVVISSREYAHISGTHEISKASGQSNWSTLKICADIVLKLYGFTKLEYNSKEFLILTKKDSLLSAGTTVHSANTLS